MIRSALGIACVLALLAAAASAGPAPAEGGCGDPALSVPLVTSVTPAGLIRAQAGTVVSAAGHVLTQWSWLKDAQRILVTLPGRAPMPAHPLGASEAHDLVLLAPASPVRLCPVSFGDVSHLKVLQTVRGYGYPLAGSLRSPFVVEETGKITAIQGPPVLAFRSDMITGPGFAGGPVLDTDGRMIGVQGTAAPGVMREGWSSSAHGLPALIEVLRKATPIPRPTRIPPTPPSVAGRAATRRQIKIAVHVSLSGPGATVGRAILDGATQAVAELSAAFQTHGLALLLIPLDDRGDVATAAANARSRLLNDPSVLMVIGHNNSGVCQDAARIYEAGALPMITPACEVATFTDSGWRTAFRVIGRDDVQGAAAAEFARSALRARTAYVAYEPDGNYGLRTAAAFWWEGKHLGMHVTGLTPVDADTLNAVSAAAAGSRPDVVYYGGAARGAAQFLKALRSLGTRAPFLGPDGLDSSEFAYFAGPAASNAFYTILDGPPRFYQGGAAFAGRFRARMGYEPGPFAALGYDAVGAGLEAIARASRGYRRLPTREEVLAALRNPSAVFHGVTGTIRFTANGDRVDAPVFVMQVRGLTWARWLDNALVSTMTP